MKIFKKMSLIQKIVIIVLAILIFSVIAAPAIHAAEFGGVLLAPIANFIAYLGDGIIGILHNVINGSDEVFITLTRAGWTFWRVLGIILAVAVIVLATIFIPGVGAAIAGFLIKAAVVGVLITATVGITRSRKCCRWSSKAYIRHVK